MRALILAWALAGLAAAAPPNETIFASSSLVLSGEHVPIILADYEDVVLTGTGAQQLYDLGQFFRQRYVSGNSSTASQTLIPSISQNTIDTSQLYILTNDTQYDSASANAFLQGLYPPFQSGAGSSSSYPLNGYQYGWVHSASASDIDSIFVDGRTACRNAYSSSAFSNTAQYHSTRASTADYYNRVAAIAQSGEVPAAAFNYDNAQYIYDYVVWLDKNNASVSNALKSNLPDAIDSLRYFADGYNWNTFGVSRPNSVNRIGGQTAAWALFSGLMTNNISGGDYSKMAAIFTGPETFVSLFSVLDLPATDPDFYGMPQPGSALVYELFTNNHGGQSYPDAGDLRVRILFRNGTADNTPLVTYISGDSGGVDMSLQEFTNKMLDEAVTGPKNWCGTCDSWFFTSFCLAYNSSAVLGAGGQSPKQSLADNTRGLDPKIAGMIGAVATLAALVLFLVLSVGFCGLRLVTVRHPPPTAGIMTETKKTGGFKGMQKLASDPDLKDTAVKHGAGITVVKDGDGSALGHTRVGSWELKENEAPSRHIDEEMRIEGEGLGRRLEPNERI